MQKVFYEEVLLWLKCISSIETMFLIYPVSKVLDLDVKKAKKCAMYFLLLLFILRKI